MASISLGNKLVVSSSQFLQRKLSVLPMMPSTAKAAACLALALVGVCDGFVAHSSAGLGRSLPTQGAGLSTRAAPRPARLFLRMSEEGEGRGKKWSASVENEDAERIESGKVAVASAVSGSIAFAPLALVLPGEFYAGGAPFTPQWELQHDSLAVMLALFGLVYRYAVRTDPNPQLKQGVVGAFVITRALAMLSAGPACTAMPLNCGAPIGYLNWSMIQQLGGAGLESALAFGGAAAFIELCFAKGWLKQFPSS